MTKKAAALFTTGIGFLSLSIPSFNDLLMQILYKLFDVTYPSQINTYVGIITGFILVITAFLITYNENKNKKTLAIIGLDTIQVSKKLKNPVIINIIDNINKLSKKNNKSIISYYIDSIENTINNYSNFDISYFGIAPIPFIALAGINYRKIPIANHYEFFQKDDNIKPLSQINPFYPKLFCEKKIEENSKCTIVTIETTCRISNNDLLQFKNANSYRFYLKKAKTNAIFSEKQLENYSEKITNELYKISNDCTQTIYLLAASQSSLIFEIFRKLNLNRSVEIIVCNYSKNAKFRYNWGLSILKNNNINYIEMREINGKH